MKEALERLSEAFVLTEIGDPQGLKVLRHRLDEILQAVPPGRIAEAIVDLSQTLDLLVAGKAADPEQAWKRVEQGILSLQQAAAVEAAPEPAPAAASREMDKEILSGFVVESREHLDAAEAQLLVLESDPTRADAVHTVFRAFHTIKGGASCLDLGPLQALAHESENLLDLARRSVMPLTGEALDLAFQAIDAMKRRVNEVEASLASDQAPSQASGSDELVLRIRRAVEFAQDGGAGRVPAPASAPIVGVSQEPLLVEDDSPSVLQTAAVKESVRVDADRLDRLVDLIGELVIAESMVSQSPELRGLAAGGALGKSVGQLDKITRELQEMGMSLRMVPVRPLFQKMARLVRDLSHKLEKPVAFATSGDEIEIDKAIVNPVADALVHVLRNALDHGIEKNPADRIRAGKSEGGRLELRAAHREGCIVIEVEDDGAGLDRDAILAKAIEKGLVRKGATLSEDEIFKLIFLPGFSTAKVVTELSGRGVGLDVVRTSVEALRGRVEVQSRRGQGTIFRLRLPLTLAIIDGMVIRAGRERFVVPTLSIKRLVRPEPGQRATTLERGEMLSLQDEVIPIFRLNRMLDIHAPASGEALEVAVVVEDAGRRAGLMADEVLGQQQIVIKSLGLDLEGVPGISGGVILPDGQVGLILDVGALLNAATATGKAA